MERWMDGRTHRLIDRQIDCAVTEKERKIRAVAGQCSSPESCFANKTKMFFRANIKKRQITGPYYTDSFSKTMTFIHQI